MYYATDAERCRNSAPQPNGCAIVPYECMMRTVVTDTHTKYLYPCRWQRRFQPLVKVQTYVSRQNAVILSREREREKNAEVESALQI